MGEVRAPQRTLGQAEFISLLALSVALAALGIDIMLPALGAIREELGLPADSTAVAGLVTAYFLGLAVGQIGYGPLADRFGRRPMLYVGYSIYAVGALASALAPTLAWLLLSRFVWGLGAAGPRVVTIAVIRDTFSGDRMARAMSLVMAVFLLVPLVAPTFGAAVVALGSWRWVFGVCVLGVAVMSLWAMRLPETLRPEHRLELRFRRIARAARFVVTDRQTVGYMLAMTTLFGAFMAYIASSEIVIGRTFERPGAFPFIFGGLALVMGIAILGNARVVGRVGTRRLAHLALLVYVATSGALVAVAVASAGRPPLALFLVLMAVLLASHALLIPNLNTVAMATMAPVAGTASSIIGSVQVAVGAVLGSVIDHAFDGTMLPLAVGFVGYGLVALAIVLVVERGRLFGPLERPVPDVPPPPVAEA